MDTKNNKLDKYKPYVSANELALISRANYLAKQRGIDNLFVKDNDMIKLYFDREKAINRLIDDDINRTLISIMEGFCSNANMVLSKSEGAYCLKYIPEGLL